MRNYLLLSIKKRNFAHETSRAVILGWTRQPSIGSHGGQYDVVVLTSKTFQIMQQHIYYIRYALQFADMQIPELVNEFNALIGNRGWTCMRSYHDQALFDEFQRRGIDISMISDGKTISFAHPIQYDILGNRLVAIR